MPIEHWPISPELQKEAAEHYRTRFAIGLKDKTPMEIIRQITFDGEAPQMTVVTIEKLFSLAGKLLDKPLVGVGLELGAGPATLSSVLAKRSAIKKIYAVEVCKPIVELLTPQITNFFLNKQADKVIGVVGDFDHLQLPNQSIDFALDFFSLHHSNNLAVTLEETYRVLKPGGFVLCFDKARPDYYTQIDLAELMDREYDAKDKAFIGWPLNQKLTRRMNGEKEYRLKDWQTVFLNSGFTKFKHFYIARADGGSVLARFIKKTASLLPPHWQLVTNRFLPTPKFTHKFILSTANRIFFGPVSKFPKEISLLIAYK